MTRTRTVLFVCGRNRLRSPTAEHAHSDRADIEVASAGTNSDADTPLTADLIDWADLIFVMEKRQRTQIRQRFRRVLDGKRIVCLDIPDIYSFMDGTLVGLLLERVARHLPAPPPLYSSVSS